MKLILQVGIVFAICLVSVGLSSVVPLPSTIIAMILMFLLLLLRVLKITHIKEKSEFLLKNMAFFFIPAGVAIIDNLQYVKGYILTLLFICFITMIVTFIVSAYTVMGVMSLQKKILNRKKSLIRREGYSNE